MALSFRLLFGGVPIPNYPPQFSSLAKQQDQICLIPDMISSALSELWSSWRQGPLTKFNLNNLFDVAILVLPHHVRAPLYHSCRRPTVFFSLEFVWRGINLNRELEMPNAGKGGCLWEAVLLLWLATATNWVPPSTSVSPDYCFHNRTTVLIFLSSFTRQERHSFLHDPELIRVNPHFATDIRSFPFYPDFLLC